MKISRTSLLNDAFLSGTISGTGLAGYLWVLQLVSGKKLLVLLLNVDFIPVFGSVPWPVWLELVFHLIISWAIAFLFMVYITVEKRSERQKWGMAFIFSGFAALSYFPLSSLAEREVPEMSDTSAIVLWFSGHVLYGVLLKISSPSNNAN